MWQVSRDSDPQRGDEDVSPSPGPIDDADGAATQSHGVGDVAWGARWMGERVGFFRVGNILEFGWLDQTWSNYYSYNFLQDRLYPLLLTTVGELI